MFLKTLFHLYHLLSHIDNECPLRPIWSFLTHTHTLEILGTLWLRGSNVDIVGIFHTIFLYKQWCFFLPFIICIVSYCQWKSPTKWSSSFDGMCLQQGHALFKILKRWKWIGKSWKTIFLVKNPWGNFVFCKQCIKHLCGTTWSWLDFIII
jgi:hypothetical protein